MGSGASTEYPEVMSEEHLKNICGDKYKPVLYRALRDVDGNVSREQFIQVVSDSLEKEVFHVYQLYCPHGEMDSRSFVKICKDAKLMNKKDLTSTECDVIFQKVRGHSGASSKTVNFSVFRKSLVDQIAEKKILEHNQVLNRFAQLEGPQFHGTHAETVKLHDDKSTFTGAHAHGGPDFKTDSTSNRVTRGEADVRGVAVSQPPSVDATPEQHRAATRLQTLHRKNTAKRVAVGMKEVHETATKEVDPDKDFDKPKEDDDNERLAVEVFDKFAVHGGMDSRSFTKLCRDADILDRKFTATDADLLFQKTKAKASAPGAGSYSSGVVHGKRVSYSVFRAVAVPLVAEKKGVKVEGIIQMIADCPGPSVAYGVTKPRATKLHDDHSTYTGTRAAAEADSSGKTAPAVTSVPAP